MADAPDIDVLECGERTADMFGNDTDYDADADEMPAAAAARYHEDAGLSDLAFAFQEAVPLPAAAAPPVTVVVQHEYGTATLRNRHHRGPAAPPEISAAPVARNAGSPSAVERARRAFIDANARYDVWKLETLEPACIRCAPRARRFVRVAATLIVVLVLVGVVLAQRRARADAYVPDTATRRVYARADVDDLTQPVHEIACTELTTGALLRPRNRDEEPVLARVRATAEAAIRDDELACICGPAIRSWRRYLAVRGGTATNVLHLYNPVLDAAWAGDIDGAAEPLNVTEWLVEEHQRAHFPDRAAPVSVVRRSAVRLVYQTAACQRAAIVLQADRAFCAQACLDLLVGHSVYDMAVVPTV